MVSCLGVTLQGNGSRLATDLELLGRVGRLHHHSLHQQNGKGRQTRMIGDSVGESVVIVIVLVIVW